jgi:hypothetical protein
MTKKSEAEQFEVKLERIVSSVGKEIKLDVKNMIDWLLFYKKPKDKLERAMHIIEVICAYVILQFAWKGLFGY